MKLKDIFKKVWFGLNTAWQYVYNKRRWRNLEDNCIYKICGGLLIVGSFFLACILIIFIKECLSGYWRLNIGPEGIKNMMVFWQQHTPLLKAFFYTATLFVACHNLIKYTDVETCRSLGEIRNQLNDKPKKVINDSFLDPQYRKSVQHKIEEYLKVHPDYKNNLGVSVVEILDYLGTLELGAMMLQRGIITKREFFDQFGYRYMYLSQSPIMDVLNEEKNYYGPLFYAMSVAVRRNKEIKRKEAKAQKSRPSTAKSDSSLANNEG